MDAVVLIPARLESSRFPRKVLADKTGMPLIQHVYQSAAASGVRRVIVATDAQEVVQVVRGFGGEVVLTSPEHENGTSRLAQAAERLGLKPDEVVVNVQGDEPELEPGIISASVEALNSDQAVSIGTVASPIDDPSQIHDPAVVKVVLATLEKAQIGRALYFSRAAIPHDRDGSGAVSPLQHIGVYAYSVGFLQTYASLAPTPLEKTEKLEQLRALEHGYQILAAVRQVHSVGIDTPEDYERFVGRWRARTES